MQKPYVYVTQLGVDPVHFGVITIFNLLLAALSPPEGGILFAVIGVLDISMGELTRWLIPQFFILLFLLFLFTFVPALSLTLPNLVMGVAHQVQRVFQICRCSPGTAFLSRNARYSPCMVSATAWCVSSKFVLQPESLPQRCRLA